MYFLKALLHVAVVLLVFTLFPIIYPMDIMLRFFQYARVLTSLREAFGDTNKAVLEMVKNI